MTALREPLVKVRQLRKYFPVTTPGALFSRTVGHVKAVDGIDFDLFQGETLGLVGESGCGKTTAGKALLRLIEPTGGEVWFEGRDIRALSREELRMQRRQMQFVFQDPYASLNPRMTVARIVGEPLVVHGLAEGKELERRVLELLDMVGLRPEHARRFPHEFSGGQRQRIGIARALALRPRLVVCDEPVSALDVSIQSQVLNLLAELQKSLGLTYLFIAHGLAAVKHLSTRVGVMYLGKLVELADGESLYRAPRHPYTEALMSAIPIPDPDAPRNRVLLEGDVPSPMNPPAGCRFSSRCPQAQELCRHEEPLWAPDARGHFVACHYPLT